MFRRLLQFLNQVMTEIRDFSDELRIFLCPKNWEAWNADSFKVYAKYTKQHR